MKQQSAFRVVCLLLLFLGIESRTYATPILYNINFNNLTGTPVPTSGSFTYDAAAALGSQFSNFVVVWDGLTFNDTAIANAGNVILTGVGCTSPDTSATVFAFLTQHAQCPGSPNTYTYLANASLAGAAFDFFDDGNPTTNNIQLQGGTASNVINSGVSGNYTVTPAATTPEPSTFLLALTCSAFLVRKRSVRLTRKSE